MNPLAGDPASEPSQSRRFTVLAFGLAALAALAIAAVVHHGAAILPIADDARSVIAWSFVGLAAFDAFMLIVWGRFVEWLADAQ